MSKCYKYSLEDKLDAIRLYLRLKNASEVGRITGICVPLVTIWYRQYQAGGPHALRIQSHGNKYDLVIFVFQGFEASILTNTYR